MKRVILASSSTSRKKILENIGLSFEAVDNKYNEDMSLNLSPVELAIFLSNGKAQSIIMEYKNAIIIGVDTFISLGGELLGKPYSDEELRLMLNKINGKELVSITGFTITDSSSKKSISDYTETKVKIKKLSKNEIENYIKTGEGLEKAGGFAIQGIGSVLVEKIEGDFFSIAGLPVYKLIERLKEFGINIL